MSRNLLRKTKRENVQTLLYQTLNFARVVAEPFLPLAKKSSRQNNPLPPKQKTNLYGCGLDRALIWTGGYGALVILSKAPSLRQNLRAPDFTVPKRYRAFRAASTNTADVVGYVRPHNPLPPNKKPPYRSVSVLKGLHKFETL